MGVYPGQGWGQPCGRAPARERFWARISTPAPALGLFQAAGGGPAAAGGLGAALPHSLRAQAPRIVGAALEAPVTALPLDQRLAADRAGLVELLDLARRRHGAVLAFVGPVLAVGVPAAGQEGAITALALQQLALLALGALLARRLGLGLV